MIQWPRPFSVLLLLAAFISVTPCGATPPPSSEWATPSTMKSKSTEIQLPPPKYPIRLKWVAEIIPGDVRKLQAIVLSDDGSNIDIVYHYDRKQKIRIPSKEIIEWNIISDGTVGPGPMAEIMIPFALILGVNETQKFTINFTFLDADGKPFSLIFDPYDNGKFLASLLKNATDLEPGEKRSDLYIQAIRDSRGDKSKSPLP